MFARHLALSLVAFSVLIPGPGAFSRVDAASRAHLTNLAGRQEDPLKNGDTGTQVFIFTRIDCPIANSYAPELRRLSERYASQGFAFKLVYCDPDETAEAVEKHGTEYRYELPAYRDPTGAFARQSKVKVTPEAAIYQPGGELVHHGRIDNRYASYGKKRAEATEHDLARAIDSLIAGRKVPPPGGSAVGCFIEDR